VILTKKIGINSMFFSVCFCNLNYLVRNNHATCYIAIYVLYIGKKLFTSSYQMYQFQKDFVEHKISVLSCSENLCMKVHIL
jgi:hypothetical protein